MFHTSDRGKRADTDGNLIASERNINIRRKLYMLIGGKEYKTGQRIRVINAKSVLHYRYGMLGELNKDMAGITGIITGESTYDEFARAELTVDAPYSAGYKNGMTRLFCDDEIELIGGNRIWEQR
jgi:hypothetical protein